MRRTQAVRQAGTSGEAAGRNEVRSSTERRRVVDDPRSITAGNSGSGAGSGSTKEKAKQQSREVAQRTRQQASRVAEEGREQAKSQLATQKERAAGQLEGVAQARQQAGQVAAPPSAETTIPTVRERRRRELCCRSGR